MDSTYINADAGSLPTSDPTSHLIADATTASNYRTPTVTVGTATISAVVERYVPPVVSVVTVGARK